MRKFYKVSFINSTLNTGPETVYFKTISDLVTFLKGVHDIEVSESETMEIQPLEFSDPLEAVDNF